MTKIKVYFVLPAYCNSDENSTSEPMRRAFELCCQNQLIPEWISEKNCLAANFVKTDVVVLDEFKGDVFKTLESKKCFSLAGPWCIITCLLEGLQIPNNGAAIYNMAMCNLTITASSYTPAKKMLLKEKIEMMGGIYLFHVTASVTHLVTNCVRTQKYAVANERNIPIMLDSWVDEVWNASLTRNIKATDDEFASHKCLIFQNLRVCCTGFAANERNKMVKLITDNGGSYNGKFVSSSIDVLICKTGTKSEKYNVARRAKVPCLKIDWIYDSIERGFCLPDHEYTIKMSCSTPTKSDAPLNVDFSMMSAISGSDINDPFKTSASETMNMSLYNMDKKNQSVLDGDKENKISNIIDNIDLKQVKQAGTFLAECSVYLTGFSSERREKLCRILKIAGATRYDDISDRVTQIITGSNNLDSNELKSLKGSIIPIVSVEWLLECIKQRQPVYEEPFTIKSTTPSDPFPSSPLSQKGLTLLQQATTLKPMQPPPPPKHRLSDTNIEQDFSQLYMDKCKSNPEEEALEQLLRQEREQSSSNSGYDKTSQESTFCALFEGKSFKLIHQPTEEIEKLTAIIEEQEGDVIPTNSKSITDYIVVPPVSSPLKHTATEVVNSLWIYDCHAEQKLLPLKYYHQPLYKSAPLNVLENCVVTISGYVGSERTYIMNLIQYLGAIYQDKFARVAPADQSVRASTHLICLETTGSKYSAAIRWKRPVVTHKWLLRCVELKAKCDESQFSLIAGNNPNTPKVNQEPEIIPVSNKRDSDGHKKSPVPDNPENNEPQQKMHEQTPGKRLKRDLFNDEDDNMSLLNSGDNDENTSQLIEVDGGRKVSIKKYMQELRDQGLFDTPSPPPKLNAGTPITEVFARLRREGKIHPPKPKLNMTPDRRASSSRDPGSGGSGGGSQGTPVGRYLRSLQERNVIKTTPKSGNNTGNESPVVRPFYDIKTPETPLGRFLGEDNPSPETRKHWQRYIDRFPHYKCHDRPPAIKQRRQSTPLSEVKREAWAWLLRDKTAESRESEASTSKLPEVSILKQPETSTSKEDVFRKEQQTETQRQLSNQIDQIQDRLKQQNKSRSSILHLDGSTPQKIASDNEQYSSKIPALHDVKDSQANTVEWDEPIESNIFDGHMSAEVSNFTMRKFMLSALEPSVRAACQNTIKSLGGEISEVTYYDHSATHVVCANPARNEKILASMAAGKWIIHHSFVEESGQCGAFLNEESYEFGNPKAIDKLGKIIQTTPVMEAMHWWRLKVLENKRGAFYGMRALIFSKNKMAIVRLIEAGDGVILNAEPPFDHNLDVTHCFIDAKLKMDTDVFIPLVEQGIHCLNVLYLSNFLNCKTNTEISDFIIPTLKDYYK